MTILVTYKTDDKIYMGCDTQTTGGTVGFCEDKWVKVKIDDAGDYVMIGVTGYAKYADFFEHGFKAPHKYKGESFIGYLHNKLAPEISKVLCKRKIVKTDKGSIDTEGEFIIVYDDVYSLHGDTAPYRLREKFNATGSGYKLAYGAYYVNRNEKDIKKMLGDCIDAAMSYDAYCGGEQVIHVMERAK